jgi:hypothetical protein
VPLAAVARNVTADIYRVFWLWRCHKDAWKSEQPIISLQR